MYGALVRIMPYLYPDRDYIFLAEDGIIDLETFKTTCLPIPKSPIFEHNGTVREKIIISLNLNQN